MHKRCLRNIKKHLRLTDCSEPSVIRQNLYARNLTRFTCRFGFEFNWSAGMAPAKGCERGRFAIAALYPLRYNPFVNTTYEIREYVTESGDSPFSDWFLGLKDKRAQVKLQLRLDRVTLGNFGDRKPVEGVKGLYELRDHYGPGYRIYYTVIDRTVVLLLAGSTKGDQKRAITQAGKYLADYHGRKKHREKFDPPT